MKILIISDGRPGHYNQSLGIVSQMKDVDFYLIEVKFRSKRRDNLLRVLVRLLGWMPIPEGLIIRLLNMALSQGSAREILTCEDYEVILSTGSSVAPINLLMGKLIDAYMVVCTRPSPLGIAYFDLAILPQHHWPRINRKNVCQTLGVPNLITSEYIEQKRKQIQDKLNLPDKSRIGVLLGGEDRYFTITQATANKLLDVLLKVCDEIDGRLALTTSRRTPQAVEELMHSRLNEHNRCVLLELASGIYPRSQRKLSNRKTKSSVNEVNIPDPVASIFAISDIAIVTEDSFSMVCEAASSGRKIIILDVDRKSQRLPRRHRTYNSIMQVANVVRCNINNLEETLLKVAKGYAKCKALEDGKKAADAIMSQIKSF